MTTAPAYDAVIISASPLGLSEALMLARQGKRVIVCDRRPQIGGAWRMEAALGYCDLEVGCHIFVPGVRVGVALQSLWRVSLAPLEPAPRTVYYVRGRYLQGPYGAPLIEGLVCGLSAVRRAGLSLLGRQPGVGLGDLLRLFAHSLRLLRQSGQTRCAAPGPLLYPPGGTGEIVRALADRIGEAGVELCLGREVTRVTVNNEGAAVTLDDGAVIRARQVVVTRGSAISAINGLVLPQRQLLRRHWVVVLEDPLPRRFSYLQFQGHPAIERVSDVTRFARRPDGSPVEPGRKILCFYVRNALYEHGRAVAEGVLLQIMKDRRWIGPDAATVEGAWWEDAEATRDYRSLFMLQDANPGLRVIREINLGAYLVNNFDRVTGPNLRQEALITTG